MVDAMEGGRDGKNLAIGTGQANVFLQLVEMVGPGSIVRVMSDRRTV